MKNFSEAINEARGDDILKGLEFYVRLVESDYDIADWTYGKGHYQFEIVYPSGNKEWVNDTHAASILANNI